MSYLYENTGPERFQRFCQSLLLSEYPGLQCFPVGQPDGGRDAWHDATKTVLQVKFRRNDEPESADWMIEALEGELSKIQRLVAAGAKQYVMVTNARGTAHPDAGRIDKVRAWMDKNIECPSVCLWRDDLDARFNVAPSTLKLKYPEMLTGADGIELALSQVFGPQKEKQLRAVRAFVASQFDKDKVVKFKQVNLSNELFDLFIDIPLRVNENLSKQLQRKARSEGLSSTDAERQLRAFAPVPEDLNSLGAGVSYYLHATSLRTRFGAARFLLGNEAQESLKRVVLEGAPGQGKSTLAQFVCQVHRARFLGKSDFIENMPKTYLESSFRLPIKIDLRDLAAFVSLHKDPATASVEDFISKEIHEGSGKLAFSADDLVDVIVSTPTLIFLDGLDEVADLDQRQGLIQAVERSISRFDEWGADLQLVITSRPSIFGKKTNFDNTGFITIDLANIDPRLVNTYSRKWVEARGLDKDESIEVLAILRDKMELSDIRELTRNPMQLTILLSLIHQVGYSLPDQRTDLYRRYLELFLIREAEKTPSVKKHSAVLVNFIQHLAWVLQSQAESAGSSGSISESDLQTMAEEYLVQAKEPPELADGLFGGGLERIFVLVQRVSGLYEFEVQPLREFFCARHLYETSPVGTYRYQTPRGDRAQRFEALAKNPFWLNVTRFYAGSYESGEIGSLVLSLKELIASPDPAVAIHGRRVAFALISDWIFANKKSWQDELIEVACDDLGLDLLAAQVRSGDTFALDEACGQVTLRSLLFTRLRSDVPPVEPNAYCVLLDANGGCCLEADFLAVLDGTTGRERSDLLVRMMSSGAADNLHLEHVIKLIEKDSPARAEHSRRLHAFVSRYSERIQDDEAAMQMVVTHALASDFSRGTNQFNLVSVFVDLLSRMPSGLMTIYRHNGDESFLSPDSLSRVEKYEEPASLVPSFVTSVARHANPRVMHAFGPDFTKGMVIADLVTENWGPDVWVADEIALRSAGLPTSHSVTHASALFDVTVDVCSRARYARLKRSSVDGWLKQREAAGDDPRRGMFWTILALCWTAPKVFDALRPRIEGFLDSLTPEHFARALSIISEINRDTRPRRDREGWVPEFHRSSDHAAVAIALAARMTASQIAKAAEGRDSELIANWVSRGLLAERLEKPLRRGAKDGAVLKWLEEVASAQRSDVPLSYRVSERCRTLRFNQSMANRLAIDTEKYPQEAVRHAQEVAMSHYTAATLTAVAGQEGWTFG